MTTMDDYLDALIDRLRGDGDRRSIGDADRIAAEAAGNTRLVDALVALLAHEHPVVAMRAADALEKATRANVAPLAPHTGRIVELLQTQQQHEVRWHLAQLVSRLTLDADQSSSAAQQLEAYLTDASQIVRVHALQALNDLAADHASLRHRVNTLLEYYAEHGGPALRARCQQLLRQAATD